jgi:hypothetical protein
MLQTRAVLCTVETFLVGLDFVGLKLTMAQGQDVSRLTKCNTTISYLQGDGLTQRLVLIVLGESIGFKPSIIVGLCSASDGETVF